MAKKIKSSPFEQDTWERIRRDPEFCAAFFEDISKRPIAAQLTIFRRLQGISQEKIAAKIHKKQNYISKLETPKSDHLISHYERVAKLLNGRLAIIPQGAHFVV